MIRRCPVCDAVHDSRADVCADVAAYRDLAGHPPRALDCVHGVALGAVVRPWCGTPGCPRCRRAHPVTWRPFRAVISSPPIPEG